MNLELAQALIRFKLRLLKLELDRMTPAERVYLYDQILAMRRLRFPVRYAWPKGRGKQ